MASKPGLYQASYNRLFGGKCQRLHGSEQLGASHVSFACGVLKWFEVNFLRKRICFSIRGGKKFVGGHHTSASREKLINQIGMQFRITINAAIFNHHKPVVRI
jgi:hypothetical protein